MTKPKEGRDAVLLQRGQRVTRKDSDKSGTVTQANGGVKVKWDGGRTSYYSREQQANVREKEPKREAPANESALGLTGASGRGRGRRLSGIETGLCRISFQPAGFDPSWPTAPPRNLVYASGPTDRTDGRQTTYRGTPHGSTRTIRCTAQNLGPPRKMHDCLHYLLTTYRSRAYR